MGISLDKLDYIEAELGADVFKIAKSINGDREAIKDVERLSSFLESSDQSLSGKQNDSISRIYAVYAYALRAANQPKDTVLKYLDMAFQYAKSDETIGLYHYVRASAVRGYAEFSESESESESEAGARIALQYFSGSSLNKGHADNCLALALMRQRKFDQVEQHLNSALIISESDIPLTQVEHIMHIIEGSLKCRTNMTRSQFFEQTGQYSLALPLAREALAEKIAAGCSAEDIAYTQITVGEILNKINQHKESLAVLMESNAIYTELHGDKPHANHLRVLIGLAETQQKQGYSSDEISSFLELAIMMRDGLALKVDHDFSKRIDILQQILSEQASLQIVV